MKFFKARKIIKDIKAEMISLLGIQNSKFVDYLWKRYPNIKKAALEANKDGYNNIKVSVDLLTITLPNIIAQMPERDRADFILYLEGKRSPEVVNDFFKIVSMFVSQIEKHKIQQEIDVGTYELAMSEICGSCVGKNFEERQHTRIQSSINQAFFPKD